MNYIDTHSHIFLKEFDEDRDAVIDAAGKSGVGKILLPAIDMSSISRLEKTVNEYQEICFPFLGLHPSSVKEDYKEEIENLFSHPVTGKMIGIGEIGIDLYWETKYKDLQIRAFDKQLDIALDQKLPVVIHVRNAFNEVFDVLKNRKENPKGVFHCFSGTEKEAKIVLDMGFYIGIGGVITFKNSKLGDVVKQIPDDRILLETDAPYLAPVPYRGKRNQPEYIPLIAQKIAEIKNCNINDVATQTTRNACALFNLEF